MKKRFLAALTAFVITTATIIGTGSTVHAAGTQKNATLTDIQVSFDEKVVTLQAYNIDGYNYIMARAVTDELDIKVRPITIYTHPDKAVYTTGKTTPFEGMTYVEVLNGISIDPTEHAEKSEIDKLTDKNISVTLQEGMIMFFEPAGYLDTEFFIADGRMFLKLADMGQASEQYRGAGFSDDATFAAYHAHLSRFKTFKVNWNETTRMVEITSKEWI